MIGNENVRKGTSSINSNEINKFSNQPDTLGKRNHLLKTNLQWVFLQAYLWGIFRMVTDHTIVGGAMLGKVGLDIPRKFAECDTKSNPEHLCLYALNSFLGIPPR